MTKLDKNDILHVAKLAKLEINEAEIEKYTSQLSSVVNYFSELNEIDTKDVEPTSQTTGLENVTRTDVVVGENVFSGDQAISGSDKIHNGYFIVDAVLKERSDK
jgi:aspartyl-tRNA(Asn)/glutamyl-tRNA(Gln) amidotransferase subunit C